VTKLIVRHGEMSVPALLEIALSHAGEAACVTTSGADFVEIAAAGVHKASALDWVCRQHGITAAQTIAFGDMLNDLPMLAWAGHSVAVANAHPDLLAHIDETTLSNEDDGVAVVLERLVAGARQPVAPSKAQ
jgi:hydroxymethylpyrimidine pyrophosphatase-like HAD family hydrolase